MKCYIYFGDSPSDISTVGMNNLIMVDDARVKTAQGLARVLARLISLYHKAKMGDKHFLILSPADGKTIGKGKTSIGNSKINKLYYELTKKEFSFLTLEYMGRKASTHIPIFE